MVALEEELPDPEEFDPEEPEEPEEPDAPEPDDDDPLAPVEPLEPVEESEDFDAESDLVESDLLALSELLEPALTLPLDSARLSVR